MDTPRFAIHRAVHEPFLALQAAAQRDGFALSPFSAFRDFEAQRRIWNGKFTGQKPVYDQRGHMCTMTGWSDDRRIEAILGWSALPGASRHHWGTEIDVVDRSRLPSGYRIVLLPEEAQPGGVFHELHQWLDEHVESFGFFRPYRAYQGGIYEEPWHLSYWPVSREAMALLSFDMLEAVLHASDLAGKKALFRRLPEVFERYIKNICLPVTL
ncbi:M15 family metallopeptidase [Pseudomonas duriflava]|uniref:M15 family metallopeptidase n=1 Tax=Pseudomonas duriflava TaxID=459528 RepID=UPI003CC7C4FD